MIQQASTTSSNAQMPSMSDHECLQGLGPPDLTPPALAGSGSRSRCWSRHGSETQNTNNDRTTTNNTTYLGHLLPHNQSAHCCSAATAVAGDLARILVCVMLSSKTESVAANGTCMRCGEQQSSVGFVRFHCRSQEGTRMQRWPAVLEWPCIHHQWTSLLWLCALTPHFNTL